MANAVLDGVDCIMLGAETLRGKHPVVTVETVLHICKQAEKVFDHTYHFETLMRVSNTSCEVSPATASAVPNTTCAVYLVVPRSRVEDWNVSQQAPPPFASQLTP